MGGSGVIPGWKIAREFDRFVQQIKAVGGLIWEPIIQRHHDRNRAGRLNITPGERPLTNRVLVYLLFQADRVLDSTIETCRLMEKEGYSTLIVSNAPLTSESRLRLSKVSWRVMQRPNYGYDFGGYRDGVLYLMEQGIRPDWLMVLNDSVWFPLRCNDTLVPRLEQSGLDVSGTIVHRSFRKTFLRRRQKRVIESYLFLFNKKAFDSQAFRDFWLKYRVSSIKYNAVHRGERQVAETMLNAGLSADGLFGRDGFLDFCTDQDCEYLKKTLRYANYTNEAFEASRQSLLARFDVTEAWRQDALAHIRTVSNKNSFFSSFPFVSAGGFDVPLIKRSNGALQVLARKSILRAVAANDIPRFRDTVMAEMLMQDGQTVHQGSE
ncbi:rhamnan synthesis F family protein [Pseudotabrizicola sp.]|uniref:rhamnan synthesis F family protein n=1 Tax=Pseudotabrizicola sp. TaxID=2939647 RepID=UPI002723EE8E|nr:rhamnan synthesis F family protein [Pseudotabrizicola sp.]MDO8884949.1 rhamnan synthesis F family protein [Pseudotabrizicola sp.]